MYELFATAQSLDESVLIRIVQNRVTVENRRILDEIRKKRCEGRVEVTLPRDSRSGRGERPAVLQMRYALYSVKRPHILNPNTDGCNGVPCRMSGSQPGNIIGYSVVPPFLPSMIDFKGAAGLHHGAGWATSIPSK
jgi:hypothetical protein